MVFFRKFNDLTSSECTDHSHFSVNPGNIRPLWQAIQYCCDEVETTAWNQVPKGQEREQGREMNKDSEDYWKNARWTAE